MTNCAVNRKSSRHHSWQQVLRNHITCDIFHQHYAGNYSSDHVLVCWYLSRHVGWPIYTAPSRVYYVTFVWKVWTQRASTDIVAACIRYRIWEFKLIRVRSLYSLYCSIQWQLTACSTAINNTEWPKKTKLSFFVHIFAKYWTICTIFSPVDSVRNLLLTNMHTTPTMSLHYLVKHI